MGWLTYDPQYGTMYSYLRNIVRYELDANLYRQRHYQLYCPLHRLLRSHVPNQHHRSFLRSLSLPKLTLHHRAWVLWKSWNTQGSTSRWLRNHGKIGTQTGLQAVGFGVMEELAYIRVYKPLPGVREICSPTEDSAAELATARRAV